MKINGNISDINNEPLQLANVTIISGTLANKMGTRANEIGDFQLEDDSIVADSLFKISYVGFQPQTFKASDLQNKKIKLLENSIVLDDVTFSSTKPKSNKTKQTINNVKDSLNQHKLIYAILGGVLGVVLITRYFKRK
jgi:hypothetical protein